MTRATFARRLLFAMALAASAAACGSPPPAEVVIYRDLGTPGASLDVAAALSLINDYRAKEGRRPMTLDADLVAIASREVERLAARDSIRLSLAAEHQLEARLEAAGYPGKGAVQNVSAGYRTLAEAFSGWRELETHNANMLAPEANRFGIATAYAPDSKYRVYWLAIFAQAGG